MKKSKILLHEQLNRIVEISGENPISGKHLVVVDIQPEYLTGFKDILYKFISFLNTNYENLGGITFLYNGYDTLGMINENEYKMWWEENGLDMEVIDGSRFYDKGYAFFRYCIDSNIDEESIVNMVRFMIDKNVNDSRDLDEEFWDEFIERYGSNDVRELLEFAGDCINIPDLMDEIGGYRGIVVCGGGVNECLKEVEIALQALDKPYNVLTQYTY
jgi:hypothetical protein